MKANILMLLKEKAFLLEPSYKKLFICKQVGFFIIPTVICFLSIIVFSISVPIVPITSWFLTFLLMFYVMFMLIFSLTFIGNLLPNFLPIYLILASVSLGRTLCMLLLLPVSEKLCNCRYCCFPLSLSRQCFWMNRWKCFFIYLIDCYCRRV